MRFEEMFLYIITSSVECDMFRYTHTHTHTYIYIYIYIYILGFKFGAAPCGWQSTAQTCRKGDL